MVVNFIHLFTLYRQQAGRPKCPVDPFFIVPDKCKCVDFQVSCIQIYILVCVFGLHVPDTDCELSPQGDGF